MQTCSYQANENITSPKVKNINNFQREVHQPTIIFANYLRAGVVAKQGVKVERAKPLESRVREL
jgi:hypothetical protein